MAYTDPLRESDHIRIEYWGKFIRYMKRRNSLIMFNEPSSKHPHQLRAKADTFGSSKFVLVALANVSRVPRIGAGVEISDPKEYYSALEKDKDGIESEVGHELIWKPETKVRDIWLYSYVDFNERHQWPEQHEWLADKLEAFRKVLKPRISKLLRAKLMN